MNGMYMHQNLVIAKQLLQVAKHLVLSASKEVMVDPNASHSDMELWTFVMNKYTEFPVRQRLYNSERDATVDAIWKAARDFQRETGKKLKPFIVPKYLDLVRNPARLERYIAEFREKWQQEVNPPPVTVQQEPRKKEQLSLF